MIRHWRPFSLVLFTAIGCVLLYGAYATPLPPALPRSVPGPPEIVVVTRVVEITPRATALPTVSVWSMTATASAEAAKIAYRPPPPTADTSCAWHLTNGCAWVTPNPAPTTAPLESYP